MFLALVIEHGTRMSRIASCVQSGSTLFFHIVSLTNTVFGEKSNSTKSVFRFSSQVLSETFLILITIKRDIILKVRRSSCKVTDIHIRD